MICLIVWIIETKILINEYKENVDYEVNVRALINGSSGDWSRTIKFKIDQKKNNYMGGLFRNNNQEGVLFRNNNQEGVLFRNNNQEVGLFRNNNQGGGLFGDGNPFL